MKAEPVPLPKSPFDLVPLPKSPFDDLVQLCVDYLEEYPALFAVMVGIPLVLLASLTYNYFKNLPANVGTLPQCCRIPRKSERTYSSLEHMNTDYTTVNNIWNVTVRGHSQMTSAERGREGVAQILTVVREVA